MEKKNLLKYVNGGGDNPRQKKLISEHRDKKSNGPYLTVPKVMR